MDNEKFQKLILQQLQALTEGQARIENRMDRLESKMDKLKIRPTEGYLKSLQQRRKPGYQPYFNTEGGLSGTGYRSY